MVGRVIAAFLLALWGMSAQAASHYLIGDSLAMAHSEYVEGAWPEQAFGTDIVNRAFGGGEDDPLDRGMWSGGMSVAPRCCRWPDLVDRARDERSLVVGWSRPGRLEDEYSLAESTHPRFRRGSGLLRRPAEMSPESISGMRSGCFRSTRRLCLADVPRLRLRTQSDLLARRTPVHQRLS